VQSAAATSASIVIPAHNEAAVIGRLLAGLLANAAPAEFDIVVVCNGCTDDTAAVARRCGPAVTVIEVPEPSKREALRTGDTAARGYPRLYVDADVELGTADVRALLRTLAVPGVLATAPERTLPTSGVSWPVRSYYRTWQRLPQVREGLFGRGVIALSETGQRRVAALAPSMSDDLAMSEAFVPAERRITRDAHVVVRPPRTIRDLLRRRIRVTTGNAQLDSTAGRGDAAKTSLGTLAGLVREQPGSAPSVAVFLAVAVISRFAARRRIRAGDFDTWLRDESSRQS
jgi:hypothetical protein